MAELHKYHLPFNRKTITVESEVVVNSENRQKFVDRVQPMVEGVSLAKTYTIVLTEWEKLYPKSAPDASPTPPPLIDPINFK